MKILLILTMFASMAMLAGGCLIVNEHREPASPPSANTPPAEDPRSIPQIVAENRDLRAKLVTAEDNHRKWQAAVEAQKRKLKDAERQRDRMKDQRDYYKKLNKHED